jgi:hypothetical protein
VTAAVRPGLDRAGGATLAEELADPGEAHGEAGGDLLLGPLAGVVGGDDPLAQVGRVGPHPGWPSFTVEG